MAYYKSRGLRGSAFEELIGMTNDKYRQQRLACIEKIPTPIKVTKISKQKRSIEEGYFEKKSSVDYIGLVQGFPVCFDAKETSLDNFPLKNIHLHQIEFMKDFVFQKGLAFILVHFTKKDEMFLLPSEVLFEYYENAQNGGKKHIPYSAFNQMLRIYRKSGYYVHYLEAINSYLQMQKENEQIKKKEE